jgi:hypothetical protein
MDNKTSPAVPTVDAYGRRDLVTPSAPAPDVLGELEPNPFTKLPNKPASN